MTKLFKNIHKINKYNITAPIAVDFAFNSFFDFKFYKLRY